MKKIWRNMFNWWKFHKLFTCVTYGCSKISQWVLKALNLSIHAMFLLRIFWPRNTNWGGRLSPVDLIIKVACFVKCKKKENNIFDIKGATQYKQVNRTEPSPLVRPPCFDTWLMDQKGRGGEGAGGLGGGGIVSEAKNWFVLSLLFIR